MDPSLMGAAIGVAVAYGLKAPRFVLFASAITGAAGAQLGGPAGSFAAALLGAECGKLIAGETRLDIILTPLVTIGVGYAVARFVGPPIDSGMRALGDVIMWATQQQPFVMGILVATLMGLALTAPISSAAIAIMLGLEGIAAGAATVGCSAQMIGFAVASYRDNGVPGLISQGIGTSMLQIGNIVKNPLILIPPTRSGIVLAPLATVVFKMVNNKAGAGWDQRFGGQIMTFMEMGFTWDVFLKVLLLHFIGGGAEPLRLVLRRWNWIRPGDMKLD